MKTHLGHYEIVAELGRGGMGVVYMGYEPSLARYVAIKELSPALSHEAMVVERFLREARSMALLNDPHIIQIYSIGQENDLPFFVMEYVDGGSVAELIKRDGHLQSDDALKIVHQTAQGLATAHDRGVIHRDIKPANLMISQRGQVKIADFGIALANQDISSKLTSAGEMVGTPGYLPPEILLGNPVDQRSDIYALGVVLFEMLTGRTPFSDASVYKLMLAVVQTEVPDVREINAEIDPGVAAILARMLIKDPAKRYQSMHELISDLEKHPLITRGGPIKLKLNTASSSPDTLIGLATPMTPALGARPLSAPPEMGRRAAAVTPLQTPAGTAPAAAAEGAQTQTRTKPGIAEPVPASMLTPAPARKSRWPLLIGAMLILLLAGGTWAMRGQLFGPTTTVADPAVLAAPGETPPMWYVSYQEQLLAGGMELRAQALVLLRPLLRKLGLQLSPELVFNLLLALLVLIIARRIASGISRSRARRSFAKRARKPA